MPWRVLLLTCLLFQDELPYNDFFEYYGPDYRLHITPSNMENMNTKKYLDATTVRVLRCERAAVPPTSALTSLVVCAQTRLFEFLHELEIAPGAQIQTGATTSSTPKILDVRVAKGEGDPDKRESGMLCVQRRAFPCRCTVWCPHMRRDHTQPQRPMPELIMMQNITVTPRTLTEQMAWRTRRTWT